MSTAPFLELLALVLLSALCSVAASTYCEGGKVTEAAVQQVLNVINTRRSTLAKGQQTNGYNGAKLPYGKNIMKVEWSCTLEKTAASFMDGTCNHTPRAPPAGSTLIGNSDYNDILQGGDNDLSTILGALLGTIDHEELSIGSASVTYSTTTGPHLRPYVNLARADVTSIGCVLEHCGTGAEANHSIYCLTDKPALTNGGTLYEIATDTCDCDPGFTCDNLNLCIPYNSTSTATTTATTSAYSGVVFPVPGPGESTMCPNTAEASTLTDALRIQFLDTHNVRRSQLAQGNIGDAGPNRKTKLPPAKNMRELIWDCTLEMEATNHVRACPVAAAGTSTNGENFHRVSSANLQYYRDGVKDAVVAWWKVYRFYSVPRQIYMATHSAASSYTQMGWALTTRLGCSIGNCTGMYTIDCRYAPKGNNIGSSQYISGPTCTACPAGTACSYLKLCL